MEANEKLLIETAERAKSNTKRINEIECKVNDINRIARSTEVLANEIKHQGETLVKMDRRLAEIEKKPADRLKQITTAIISALAGGVISYMLTNLLLNLSK